MKSVTFPQVNAVLAKDQPEYEPLHVAVEFESQEVPMTACFELSDDEIAEIVKTRKIYYTQLTFGKPFQPIRISTQNPFV